MGLAYSRELREIEETVTIPKSEYDTLLQAEAAREGL